jgi:hypothetical protein
MSDEGTRRSRMEWIASVFHPNRMIAAPTLAAIKAILSGRRVSVAASVRRDGGEALALSLADVPELEQVGGIARVTVETGEQVGIARVGRNSFVGYRLEEDVLREVEVELDETAGRIRIVGAPA